MSNSEIKILDIPFTTLNQNKVIDLIGHHLTKSGKALFIATPNPEMLLAARKNQHFHDTLLSTDLNIPDGNGIIWAHRYLKTTNKLSNPILLAILGPISLISFIFRNRSSNKPFNQAIHGSDLMLKTIDQFNSKHAVFLLGNKHGLNSDTAGQVSKILLKKHPKSKGIYSLDSTPADQKTIGEINNSKAEMLFIGFGAPHQENWIKENLPKLKHIKLAIGIGGSLDFIAGILPRAPEWMRKIGLEWLFRVYQQPKRIGRIINATLVFPYRVIAAKTANPHKYRISDI